MDSLAQEKLCQLKQWRMKHQQLSLEQSVLSSSKSIWEMDLNWSENSSRLLKSTLLRLFSSTRQMQQEPRDMILTLEEKKKYKELCWSCSISLTDSTVKQKSRSSWQPTKFRVWIQLLSDQAESIEKLSFQCQISRQNTRFSRFIQPR